MSCDDFRLSRRRFPGRRHGPARRCSRLRDDRRHFHSDRIRRARRQHARGAQPAWRMRWPVHDRPARRPGYTKARPTLAVPTKTLLAKDSMFGLHPEFEPLALDVERRPLRRRPGRRHAGAEPQPLRGDGGGGGRRPGVVGPDRLAEPDDRAYSGRRSAGGHAAGHPDAADVPVGPAEAISARQLADFRLPGGDDKMAQARMRRALTALWGKQATRPVRRHRPRSTCPRQ